MSKRICRRDEREEIEEAGDVYVDVQVLLEMSGVFSRVEPEIFLNIMSRVPLKSLSQCRWVAKSWYKLIKSPSFAEIQYEWAINNNPSPWVFFWTPRKESKEEAKDLYLVDDQVFDNLDTSGTAHPLKLNRLNIYEDSRDFPRYFQTAGYVNGLICLAPEPGCYRPTSIYICNPITGDYITIPKSSRYKIPAITAFGFDPTTNEYKVIRLMNTEDEDGEYLSSEGEVYTLGRSTGWRKIEDVPHVEDVLRCGVLLNGNLHWISYVSDSCIIIAFNVGSEKFDVIQPPLLLQNDNICKRLVVVEGHLCLLHKENGNPYEIWVMTSYGVQTSWVKKYNFNSKAINWYWYGSHDLIKLRSGEFLIQFEKSKKEFLGYLDPEKDTLRPIWIRRHNEDHRMDYCFRSVVQVGSLFSPKDVAKSRRGRKA